MGGGRDTLRSETFSLDSVEATLVRQADRKDQKTICFVIMWGKTSRKAAIYFVSLVHLIQRGENEKQAIRRG